MNRERKEDKGKMRAGKMRYSQQRVSDKLHALKCCTLGWTTDLPLSFLASNNLI